MAFNKFIKAALTKDEITLYGDGEQSRDFTFIDDIVSANILAAEKGKRGGVYNLGGGSIITVTQVLATLEKIIGPLKVKRLEKQRGDARHTSANVERAKRELGYAPKVSVQEGIAREVAWMESVLSR